MVKDLIIGAYTNYNWDQIKYWANSIDKCGFIGDKAVIVYNSDYDTVKKLSDLNFNVIIFNQDPITQNYYWPNPNLIIVVQRFYHLWQYVSSNYHKYRYVITTDVKDVVFQTNPSIWLENNIGDSEIVASCEGLIYEDEPWGNDNLKGSYPMWYESLKNNLIWNCGVQAGKGRALSDLWFQIWSMCAVAGRHNPDQAAYNILLNSIAWKKLTRYALDQNAWTVQCGTQMDPEKLPIFGSKLIEPMPTFDGQYFKNHAGNTYSIVHQYDRIPTCKSIVEKLYE